MRAISLLTIGVALLLVAVPVAASLGNSDNPGSDNRPTVIVEYGTGKDAGLVKVTHIHYAKSADKAKPSKPATCSKLAGWKWTAPVRYQVQDTTGEPALSIPVSESSGTWDAASSRDLFSGIGSTTGRTWGTLDSVNLVTYGDYASDGVIAVTATWYSRFTKTAVESDILFDTDFAWGDATGAPDLMDLQNIATHEIGHTLGLSDLYTGSCSAVTMYGYSSYGDIAKRSLEPPDITGLRQIYGA